MVGVGRIVEHSDGVTRLIGRGTARGPARELALDRLARKAEAHDGRVQRFVRLGLVLPFGKAHDRTVGHGRRAGELLHLARYASHGLRGAEKVVKDHREACADT